MARLLFTAIETKDGQEIGNDELYFSADGITSDQIISINGGSRNIIWGVEFDGNTQVTLWEDDGRFQDDLIQTQTITWDDNPSNGGRFEINFQGDGASYDVWFDIA
jgi:hypothetical protein